MTTNIMSASVARLLFKLPVAASRHHSNSTARCTRLYRTNHVARLHNHLRFSSTTQPPLAPSGIESKEVSDPSPDNALGEARAATAGDSSPRPQPPLPAWVTLMNDSISRYRWEVIACYILGDIASIGISFALVDAMGMEGSADLALALAVSRLLRKFRLPVDVAVAAGLARAYPPLTQVKLTQLFARTGPTTPDASGGSGWLFRLRGIADTYGIAFLVSQRMVVGLASVGTIYYALRTGVDVQAWLEAYGVGWVGASGELAGRYAAAMCIAALAYPAVVLGAGAGARLIGGLRLKFRAQLKNKK